MVVDRCGDWGLRPEDRLRGNVAVESCLFPCNKNSRRATGNTQFLLIFLSLPTVIFVLPSLQPDGHHISFQVPWVDMMPLLDVRWSGNLVLLLMMDFRILSQFASECTVDFRKFLWIPYLVYGSDSNFMPGYTTGPASAFVDFINSMTSNAIIVTNQSWGESLQLHWHIIESAKYFGRLSWLQFNYDACPVAMDCSWWVESKRADRRSRRLGGHSTNRWR